MRTHLIAAALLLSVAAPLHAAPPKLAVFDLELVDTSLQGEVSGPRNDERDRLLRAGDQLRRELTQSGEFELLDIAPVNAAAHGANLQACGGCDVQLARQLGADFAMTGVVQKVSNLILSVTVYLRRTDTGHLATSANADMRGNTDESWSRTISYLVRNRLRAPHDSTPRPQ